MEYILYKSGYKYQLQEEYSVDISIKPDEVIETPFIKLDTGGKLTIKPNYPWDGASWPAIDTLTFMRGSLIHDALYQLVREKDLDVLIDRKEADCLLREHCKKDGMFFIRAWWVYLAVRLFGGRAVGSASKNPAKKAPDVL